MVAVGVAAQSIWHRVCPPWPAWRLVYLAAACVEAQSLRIILSSFRCASFRLLTAATGYRAALSAAKSFSKSLALCSGSWFLFCARWGRFGMVSYATANHVPNWAHHTFFYM